VSLEMLRKCASQQDCGFHASPFDEELCKPQRAAPHVLMQHPDIYILNKPAGWTISACDETFCGNTTRKSRLDVNRLLLETWITATVGPYCPIALDPSAEHGLVHRLDQDTSGILACASNYQGFYLLQAQFCAQLVTKEYVCLCHGHISSQPQLLRTRLSWSRQIDGTWRAVVLSSGGREAITEILAAIHMRCPAEKSLSLLRVRLHTGRRHQIRAHLSAEGHPLVGDTLYGGSMTQWCRRVFLHASFLSFSLDSENVAVKCRLADDLRLALSKCTCLPYHADAETKLSLDLTV